MLLEVAAYGLPQIVARRSRSDATPDSMGLFRQHDQVVVFPRSRERIYHLHGRREGDVVVAGTMDEKQLAFEVIGKPEVRAVFVRLFIILWQTHIGLDESDKVGQGHRWGTSNTDVIDIGDQEHGADGKVTAPRVTQDAYSAQVHVRSFVRQLLECREVVRNLVATEVSVDHILERLAPIRGPTPIHLEYDKAQLGQGLGVYNSPVREPTWHRGHLRACIDHFNHRVLLVRVEIEGFVEDSVEVGFPIGGFDHELLWWFPPKVL